MRNLQLDIVEIKNLSFAAIIGIFDCERSTEQTVTLHIKMQSHSALAALTGNIKDALDYKKVSECLINKIQQEKYLLLETLCEECALLIQQEFNVDWLRFCAFKPDAIEQAEKVGLCIERGTLYPQRRLWLSLGSNIEAEKKIKSAIQGLEKLFGLLVISPIYESVAVGFKGDPFLNLVVGIQSDLPLFQIEKSLKILEKMNGRVKTPEKFSARTLDIDILTWGNQIIKEEDEILKYAFVLKPLSDIAPHEQHPVLNQTYQNLWENFSPKEPELKLKNIVL